MTTPELSARAGAARRVVMGQTELMHRDFGKAKSAWKKDGTRVTATDIAISENIRGELARLFPEDQFFSEELTDALKPIPLKSRFSWILDPIDGTSNFALGIPHCAISLGLMEAGEPVFGAIYDLGRKTLLHGGPGFGAREDDREIRVISENRPAQIHIGLHSPYDEALVPVAAAVMGEFKIRGLGSATLNLAYVAAGRLDGCVDFNVKIWDIAAAIPLCRAAGGEIHFIDRPILPLKEFDLGMKRIVFVAGSPGMCVRLKAAFS